MSTEESRDQDTLDNIIAEDDFNQSEDIDTLPSFSRMDGEEEAEDKSFQDLFNGEAEEELKEKQRPDEAQVVLQKIIMKEKSIFKMMSRKEYNHQKSENFLSSTSFFSKNHSQKREILNYSRREKSLEELSKKFLSLFLDKRESLLSLDKITNQLGVERRRIYDIINILESLKLVSRKGKNNYKWNGFQCIYDTISYYDTGDFTQNDEIEMTADLQKREKSLEMLSIGFLKLFLHFKKTMTLEEAARRLSSKVIDDHKIKTKIRRLYDIANVFKSLGLIQKTSLSDTKKPAFCWVGVSGLDQFALKIMTEKEIECDQIIKEEELIQKNILQESKKNQLRNSILNSLNNSNLSNFSKNRMMKLTNLLGKSNDLGQQISHEQPEIKSDKDKMTHILEQSSSSLLETLNSALFGIKPNTPHSQNYLPNNNSYSHNISPQFKYPSNKGNCTNSCGNLNLCNQHFSNNNNSIINSTQQLSQLLQLQKKDSSGSDNYNSLINNLMMKCLQNMLNNCISTLSSNNVDSENKLNSYSEDTNTQYFPQINNIPSSPEGLNCDLFCKKLSNISNSTCSSMNNYCGEQQQQQQQLLSGSKTYFENLSNQVNDENIPFHQNNLQKTPLLKKTLTIIQPKAYDFDENNTTPTTTFSSNKATQNFSNSKDSLLFSDKTNLLHSTGSKLLNGKSNNQSGFKQHSSFKKIKKLTYDNFSENNSADKKQFQSSNSSFQQLKHRQQQQQQIQQEQQLNNNHSDLLSIFNCTPLLQNKVQELFSNKRVLERYY